jgi:hypothetical protein
MGFSTRGWKLRSWLGAVVIAAGLSAGGIVLAQDSPAPAPPPAPPAGDGAAAGEGAGTSPSADTPAAEPAAVRKYADLSDAEILAEANRLQQDIERAYQRVVRIRENERKKRPIDTIKLNCVNEHLITLTESSEIVSKNNRDVKVYVSNGDRATRNDVYADLVIAHDIGVQAAAEAEQCIGDDLSYVGDTDIEVQGGDEPDDPTQPQEPDFPEVDFPVCASCFY